MSTRIIINNLTKKFGDVVAVNNVSLVIEPETFLTLLGPSGCGKTTLLRCLAGLEEPNDGEIIIGDKLVYSRRKGVSLPAGERDLGLVFQNYALWPHMTVYKNITFALEIQKMSKADMDTRVKEALAEVKMDGYEDRYPREPISWKGTLQQYAGRLHRLFEGNKEVQIYDYIDIHIGALEKMYRKRLAGYAAIGYRTKAESVPDSPADIIFDSTSFLPVYQIDMKRAAREAVIVSPFVTRRRASQMLPYIQSALANGVSVTVVTRPANAYKDRGRPFLDETLTAFRDAGVRILFKPNIHQKFAVIDRKIVWYGSINLLSYGSAQESIMRLESPNIAQELVKDLGLRSELGLAKKAVEPISLKN